jgi:hypothetical protein
VISIGDIYDKDVNFLFGSGASFGLFPTLQLGMKRDDNDKNWSLEDLATHFENSGDARRIPLFMHYYASCIRPAEVFNVETANACPTGQTVIANYRTFIETILAMLQRRKALDRRCNLFTTNYDGCFPLVADEILRQGDIDFVLNDGTRGFKQRVLQARNFSTFLCQTGVFGRHQSSIPQINLIHLHGSVYWQKSGSGIAVSYDNSQASPLLNTDSLDRLKEFSATLSNSDKNLADLTIPKFTPDELTSFWAQYTQMPIVNPTKWKFHETVFEEHYYQMLRLLSYELEKPNAVLVTFGFSFADEHILNLVKRSLSNPGLQLFVCCFSKAGHEALTAEFRGHRNVQCLVLDDGYMDFSAFNAKVLRWPEQSGFVAHSTAAEPLVELSRTEPQPPAPPGEAA